MKVFKEPTKWVEYCYQFFCPDCGELNYKRPEDFEEYDVSVKRNIQLYKTTCKKCTKNIILPSKHIIFRREYVTPKEIASHM